MTKHLTLLLFIGLAFWNCEDSESNQPDSKTIFGLWEERYAWDDSYDYDSHWNLLDHPPTFWTSISEKSTSICRLDFWATDTACYTDWMINEAWELFGEDSGGYTYTSSSGDVLIVSYKAIEDSLLQYYNLNSLGVRLYKKSIRIETLEPTPICDD